MGPESWAGFRELLRRIVGVPAADDGHHGVVGVTVFPRHRRSATALGNRFCCRVPGLKRTRRPSDPLARRGRGGTVGEQLSLFEPQGAHDGAEVAADDDHVAHAGFLRSADCVGVVSSELGKVEMTVGVYQPQGCGFHW